MILLDSLYVNDGGGRILLDYLVDTFERSHLDVFYLFDERCVGSYTEVPENRKVFIHSSLRLRHRFYKKHRHRFSSVLCFGNLAPTVKLNSLVYTYFHQTMYLNVPREFGLKYRLLFKLKTLIFRKLLKNTDYLLLQNRFIKQQVHEKFGFDDHHIKTIPFYPSEELRFSLNKDLNSFIYVSGGAEHKNHIRLINAFSRHYKKSGIGELYITVPFNNEKINSLVRQKVSEGIPIINIGFVPRKELLKYYSIAEYLVFPSLEESFGLGIIEAIECGCKVVGADLPYMHQVCQPSILFNPFSENDIERAFQDAIDKNEENTVPLISNKIDELLDLLV